MQQELSEGGQELGKVGRSPCRFSQVLAFYSKLTETTIELMLLHYLEYTGTNIREFEDHEKNP